MPSCHERHAKKGSLPDIVSTWELDSFTAVYTPCEATFCTNNAHPCVLDWQRLLSNTAPSTTSTGFSRSGHLSQAPCRLLMPKHAVRVFPELAASRGVSGKQRVLTQRPVSLAVVHPQHQVAYPWVEPGAGTSQWNRLKGNYARAYYEGP